MAGNNVHVHVRLARTTTGHKYTQTRSHCRDQARYCYLLTNVRLMPARAHHTRPATAPSIQPSQARTRRVF